MKNNKQQAETTGAGNLYIAGHDVAGKVVQAINVKPGNEHNQRNALIVVDPNKPDQPYMLSGNLLGEHIAINQNGLYNDHAQDIRFNDRSENGTRFSFAVDRDEIINAYENIKDAIKEGKVVPEAVVTMLGAKTGKQLTYKERGTEGETVDGYQIRFLKENHEMGIKAKARNVFLTPANAPLIPTYNSDRLYEAEAQTQLIMRSGKSDSNSVEDADKDRKFIDGYLGMSAHLKRHQSAEKIYFIGNRDTVDGFDQLILGSRDFGANSAQNDLHASSSAPEQKRSDVAIFNSEAISKIGPKGSRKLLEGLASGRVNVLAYDRSAMQSLTDAVYSQSREKQHSAKKQKVAAAEASR